MLAHAQESERDAAERAGDHVSVEHVTACRLCGGDLSLVVSFTPTPPGDQYITPDRRREHQPCYPLDVMACDACGAVQLADTVDPTLIYPEYLYTTSVSRGLDAHFYQYAEGVIRRCGTGAVVDIGSNDGTLLRAFRTLGCEVQGIDPAMDVALRAEASGIPTTCGFFSEAMAARLSVRPQIITANHVMANVADLPDFVRGVKTLLAPDGTFVFETGYWPSIVDGNLIDTIEHEHIHYFAVTPLVPFFARHGLTLVSVEINQAKGGSLRGYVQHAAVGRPDASVTNAVIREAKYTPARLSEWCNELERIERSLSAQIAAAQDEVWVGYGAAVGSTLLLHHFGLGEKLLCLVDANPAKHGRLSPGFHLRVQHPDSLRQINPDRIVILAWRYADMIQAQHPECAGKWLLPLPQMVTA